MELNGFMIGPEIKTLFKIKVGAVIAEHPVGTKGAQLRIISLEASASEGARNGKRARTRIDKET